jgi:cytochrome c oxidase subunit 2
VRPAAAVTPAPPQAPQAVANTGFAFPIDRVPAYAIPRTPIPAGLTFPDGLTGDPQRGLATYSRSVCIGCHVIKGNPASLGIIGPNLTHLGSRTTLAAGIYPNDDRHLALWIKNARALKPGILMPTLGIGQVDPMTRLTASRNTGGLTDQEIADIVAYLRALK